MPKRKRTVYEGDGDRVLQNRKKDVQEKLIQGKKLLHRALKTAKGFERQKLGKRLKVATTNGHTEDVTRINREIQALKGLDLGTATDAHLHKTLLKTKVFAESELLPDETRKILPKPEGSEEMLVAMNNVISGIYNTKPVKDTMAQVLNTMYIVMSIPVPEKQKKEKKGLETPDPEKDIILGAEKRIDVAEIQKEELTSDDDQTNGSSWSGLDSGSSEDNTSDQEKKDDQESFDEEELAHYDTFLGASSDEESFDEELYKSKKSQQSSMRVSLSLSPTPSESPSISEESSFSLSKSPEQQLKPAKVQKKAKETSVKVGGSTFLPTLMGGYWSGSEESASDLDDAPKAKKNRPGQMARRAIWEKKFGEKANHITSGKGPVVKGKRKDDGWDPKRGAKDVTRGRSRDQGFGTRGGGSGRGSGRNFEKVTGENAVAVKPRGRGLGKKDDVGVLHPSWQAAKKAKELKKTASFQGKKVTFD